MNNLNIKVSKTNRSNKCDLNYCKLESLNLKYLEEQFLPTEEDKNNSYNPFRVENLQSYMPIYTLFFKMNETNYSNISLNNKYHMVNMNTVFDIENNQSLEKKVFILNIARLKLNKIFIK